MEREFPNREEDCVMGKHIWGESLVLYACIMAIFC